MVDQGYGLGWVMILRISAPGVGHDSENTHENLGHDPENPLGHDSENAPVFLGHDSGESHRISTTSHDSPDAIQEVSFLHDAEGRLQTIQDAVSETSTSLDYNFHRLKSSRPGIDDSDTRIQIDYVGENVVRRSDIGDFHYDGPPAHALTKAGADVYEYDASGRAIIRRGQRLAYNSANQLIRSEPAVPPRRGELDRTPRITYQYDANGHLLRRTIGRRSTWYVGGEYEIDADDEATKYLVVDGILFGRRIADTTEWVHTDDKGSVAALTDANGQVTMRRAYGLFRAQSDSHPASWGYLGLNEELDGLVRIGARVYDRITGRFLTPDPLPRLDPLGLNRYQYGGGDAANYVERIGTYEEVVHGALVYHFAYWAGFTAHEAAIIALSSAAADHDVRTDPMQLGNLVSFRTAQYHFNREYGISRVVNAVELQDLNLLGRALHTLADTGFSAEHPGPHARYVAPGRIFGAFHGVGITSAGELSHMFSHNADQAWQEREANLGVFVDLFRELRAAAMVWHPDTPWNRSESLAQAGAAAADVLFAKARQAEIEFLNKPLDSGNSSSYMDILRQFGGETGLFFNLGARWYEPDSSLPCVGLCVSAEVPR